MCITCGVKEESSGGLPQPGSSQPHLSPPHHLEVIWQPLGTRSPGPVGGAGIYLLGLVGKWSGVPVRSHPGGWLFRPRH